MTINDVFDHFHDDLRQIEIYMESYLRSEIILIPEIIRHIVGSGGKRFRPLLLLAASSMCGYHGKRRYPMAAIIEFIHTASLLHDDVIDEADTRRGKSSANRLWGNAASVLVGDFLYSKSFCLMTEHGNPAIIKLLSETTNTMSEGEVLQLTKRGDLNITEQNYLDTIDKKTAVLMAASCAMGGHLGDAAPVGIAALARFGQRLGTAFQMTDDILDYVAEEKSFGKAIGKDLGEKKLTLPLIRALGQCAPAERDYLQAVLAQNEWDDTALAKMTALINRYDGIDYTLAKARSLTAEARNLLDPFPASAAKEALLTIAAYITDRRI
jgi:octaprenyl-diphosphate synthase